MDKFGCVYNTTSGKREKKLELTSDTKLVQLTWGYDDYLE